MLFRSRAEIWTAVGAATTIDGLKASVAKAADLTEDDRAKLKVLYVERKTEIEAAS